MQGSSSSERATSSLCSKIPSNASNSCQVVSSTFVPGVRTESEQGWPQLGSFKSLQLGSVERANNHSWLKDTGWHSVERTTGAALCLAEGTEECKFLAK